MTRFLVQGSFEQNGQYVELNVEASSYKEAERIANGKGILVNDVLVAEELQSQTVARHQGSGRPVANHPVPQGG